MTIQCCKCKRSRIGGLWTKTSVEASELVSHTYCPACADETHIELFSQQASRPLAFEQINILTRLVAR